MRGSRAIVLASLASFIGLVGCPESAGAPLVCLDAGIDPACAPAYEPTFDAVFANTFQPSCAKSGVSCHASTGRQGDLDFSEPEAAFVGVTAKLEPGRPECSVIVHRVVATTGDVRMPPGRSLPAGEQCAIMQWIRDGARRR